MCGVMWCEGSVGFVWGGGIVMTVTVSNSGGVRRVLVFCVVCVGILILASRAAKSVLAWPAGFTVKAITNSYARPL